MAHLIKLAFAGLSAIIALTLGFQVAGAWSTMATSKRTLDIVGLSGRAFSAMASARTDRSTITRTWPMEGTINPDTLASLAKLRATEMPALHDLARALPNEEFAARDTLLPALKAAIQKLEALQAEYDAGIKQPKSSRRPALANEYDRESTAMQATVEAIAAQLFASVKNANAAITQRLQTKQLAWMLRNTIGEASVVISSGLAAGHLPPEARTKMAAFLGGADALWRSMDDIAAGSDLPPSFTATLDHAKTTLNGQEYVTHRSRLLEALITGAKPEVTADQWVPYSVARMQTLQDVAELALFEARTLASTIQQSAITDMVVRCTLLAAALLCAACAIIVLTRRVTGPLHRLRQAMMALAGGDLSVEAPFLERSDEIGALGQALAAFRTQALDKRALEQEQNSHQTRRERQQTAMHQHIEAFQTQIGRALQSLGAASTQMDQAAGDMTANAARSNDETRTAANAAERTSETVASIAAATEQLSGSIAEINRQVSHASLITRRAVAETTHTQEAVRGLAETASRISKVVNLIGSIARQTNLLALNATIEAARAGDAGKGFAVVASEVKSLASQTAIATGEISAQIAAVQSATADAVCIIEQIGATITEVSQVATAIAGAVEQQGASTQEIARSTQQAARLTRETSSTVVNVTQGANASGATATNVKAAAVQMGAETNNLRDEVETFLRHVRAA